MSYECASQPFFSHSCTHPPKLMYIWRVQDTKIYGVAYVMICMFGPIVATLYTYTVPSTYHSCDVRVRHAIWGHRWEFNSICKSLTGGISKKHILLFLAMHWCCRLLLCSFKFEIEDIGRWGDLKETHFSFFGNALVLSAAPLFIQI